MDGACRAGLTKPLGGGPRSPRTNDGPDRSGPSSFPGLPGAYFTPCISLLINGANRKNANAIAMPSQNIWLNTSP